MKYCILTLSSLLLYSQALLANEPGSFKAPNGKPHVIEVKDTAEAGKLLLEVSSKISARVPAALEFLSEAAEGYKLLKTAGLGAKVSSKVLSKIGPAAPFIITWFAANAPLENAYQRLNKRVALEAVEKSLSNLSALVSLNQLDVISHNGKEYKTAELLSVFKEIKKHYAEAGSHSETRAAAVEALRTLIPWSENETAKEDYEAAVALLLLAQGVQDLSNSVLLETEGNLQKKYKSEASLALNGALNGMTCKLYITCMAKGLTAENASKNYRTIDVPVTYVEPLNSDPEERLKLDTLNRVLNKPTGTIERVNFGCAKNDQVQKVFYHSQKIDYLEPVPGLDIKLKLWDLETEILKACKDVPDRDGTYFLRTSTYQINGFELGGLLINPPADVKAFRQAQNDYELNFLRLQSSVANIDPNFRKKLIDSNLKYLRKEEIRPSMQRGSH